MINDTMNKEEKEEKIYDISFDDGYGCGILAASIFVSLLYIFRLNPGVITMFVLTFWGAIFLFKAMINKRKFQNEI